MNFFEAQAKAKRSTFALVALFLLGVIGIILMTSLFIMFIYGYFLDGEILRSPSAFITLFEWRIFFITTGAVLAVVILGSLYKLNQLSAGGHVVADALNGELIPRDTTNFKYRQLLNVVEEMSIASGISAPPVYVLNEDGINAFAAGLTYDDAVIGITEGALQIFTREELQGVIAHEFSHIFNGDMRLNIRITGLLHGILLIGLIGREVLYSMGRSRRRTRIRTSSSSGKKNNGQGAVVMLGLGLTIIGFVGTTIGEIIKAFISRQREYLADASAVQYTRYPEGIANALRKIGGASSVIEATSSSTFSHLYFANGIKGFWANLFSTHPPLNKRISRVYPRWDGSYLTHREKNDLYERKSKSKKKEQLFEAVTTTAILSTIEQIGEPNEQRVDEASSLLESIPNSIKSMSENPLSAQAVIFALLCSNDKEQKDKQMKCVELCSTILLKQTSLALIYIEELPRKNYLTLMRLCITSLKMMSLTQYKTFKKCSKDLIQADNKLTLLEWNMQHLIFTPLDIVFGINKTPKERYSNLGDIREEVSIFISILAKEQKSNEEFAKEAFDTAKKSVGASSLKYIDIKEDIYDVLERSVKTLESAKLGVRKKILDMAVIALEYDGVISAQDLEMLNATASILRLPLPLVLSE